MKNVYPIVLKKGSKDNYIVFIPDFNINTEGEDMATAIEMARDAIGIVGIDMEDEHEDLPKPSAMATIEVSKDEFVSLVDVDFDEYRRKNDMRTIRKNCTIPSWLNFEAEKAGINFSATLQAALKAELHLKWSLPDYENSNNNLFLKYKIKKIPKTLNFRDFFDLYSWRCNIRLLLSKH